MMGWRAEVSRLQMLEQPHRAPNEGRCLCNVQCYLLSSGAEDQSLDMYKYTHMMGLSKGKLIRAIDNPPFFNEIIAPSDP